MKHWSEGAQCKASKNHHKATLDMNINVRCRYMLQCLGEMVLARKKEHPVEHTGSTQKGQLQVGNVDPSRPP